MLNIVYSCISIIVISVDVIRNPIRKQGILTCISYSIYRLVDVSPSLIYCSSSSYSPGVALIHFESWWARAALISRQDPM